MIAAEVQWPCRSPNEDDFAEGRSSIRWRKASPASLRNRLARQSAPTDGSTFATRLWAVPLPLTLCSTASPKCPQPVIPAEGHALSFGETFTEHREPAP